jgi:hypothetical protein
MTGLEPLELTLLSTALGGESRDPKPLSGAQRAVIDNYVRTPALPGIAIDPRIREWLLSVR